MKKTLLINLLILPFALIHAQQWEQLSGEPEGGGVTDIYYDEDSGDLFVATGSLNWPSGEDGGIRRSTDEGATWSNVFDAYTSRFVFRGPDGELYASVWDYPSEEGLYRSNNDGSTWELLTSVPSGNNIFACAIKEGTYNTLFAGTGQGVLRSTDNGANWSYANNGIPANTVVRSVAVSPDGSTIAAGTVNGLYVSTDDGDSWEKVTGDGQNEIVTSLLFEQEPSKSGTPIMNLFFGTESGLLLLTSSVTTFTVAALITTLVVNAGITRIMTHRHPSTLVPIYMATLWAATGGAFLYAIAGLSTWQPWMNGLPSNALISMFTSYLIISTAEIIMFIAMYGNSKSVSSGSEIYKATFDISTGTGEPAALATGFSLGQNFPNPFMNQSRINFNIPESASTSLKVFDMAGNEVLSLIDGPLEKGKHSVDISSEGLSRGIYYYVLKANEYIQTRKLVIQ